MKKLFLVIIFLYYCILLLDGQKWNWSNHLVCDGAVNVYSVAVDNNNNTYLAGTYSNSTLSVGTDTINNFGDQDGFVCKFDPNGTLQWLKRIGGSGRDIAVKLVIANNNLYVAGDFRSTILYFTPADFLANTNNFDAFLCSYDLNGNFLNATRIFYGSDIDRIKDMVFDQAENSLIISGQFKNEIKYYDGTSEIIVPAKSAINKDLLVVKSNLAGEIQDTAFYEITVANSMIKDVNLCQSEGYFLSGDLLGTLYFTGSDSIVGNTTYNSDAMVFKIDKNLNFQWARKGGGTGYDHGNSAISDKYGNIYITGKAESYIVFDSTATLGSHTLSSFGAQDLFLAKYNKLGTLQYIKRKGDAGADDGFGITQRENLVQFCGNIAGTVIFNADTIKTSGISDVNTGFAIFNTNGNEIGAKGIGGTGLDRGEVITFASSGNTIIGGYFDSPSIDIGDSTFINSSGTYNGFIAEYYYPLNAVFTEVTNVSCYGGNNGNLIATPYFGVGPYDYEWSANVTSSNDSLAYNLETGLYSVTITDSRDSTASSSIQITSPLAISITLDSTNLSCYESGDGAIDIEVTGGTGGYSYSWTGGSGLDPTGSDQSNLYAGLYKVTVSDNSLCQANDSITVAEPNPITFAGTVVTPAYSTDSCTGTIDLDVQGGTPGYSYEWEKGGFPMPGRTSDTLNNLCGDTYVVTITDSHTCTQDTTIVVTAIDELVVYIDSVTHVKCNGDNNGYARVGITGDLGFDYTYHWEDSGGATVGTDTNYIANVSGGLYYITVTENGGDNRTDSTSVNIQEPALLTTQIDSTPPLCYGDANGSINLTVSGGKPVYSYTWSSGQTSEDLSNIPGSDEYYRVTVTDKNGCQTIDSVLLEEPAQLTVNITILQEIRCNGYTNGILRANVTGGTGTIDFLWDDPGNQTTQIASGLDANIYTVTVTDDNYCQNTAGSELTDPDPISIAQVDTTHISCKGLSDGSILVTPAGGTLPYTYDWDRVPLDTNYITGLSSAFGGYYSVTVTDFYGCPPAEATIQIKEPATALNVTEDPAYHEDNLCFGYSTGELAVSAEGGWGSYEYSLNNIDWNTETLFTELSSGSYYVKVRDNLFCRDSILVSITQPTEVNLQEVMASHQNVLCFGGNTGHLEVTTSGGTPGYEYSADKLTWDTNPEFENLVASDYNIWVRDTNECYDSMLISITQASDINFQEIASSHEDVLCYGDSTGQIQVNASGGTPGYEYSDNKVIWNLSPVFENLPAADHRLWVRDANECTDSADFTITQPDKILIDPAVSNDTLQIEATGGTPPYEYSVDGGSYVSAGFFPGLAEGEHPVIVIDDNNCTADTIILIDTIPGTEILPVTIYDAFSPNADGKNEVWNIGNIDSFPECEVKIYNTWGKLVFSSTGYPEPWDGKHDGKNLPAGTYYYIIDLGDGTKAYTGTVNIVK